MLLHGNRLRYVSDATSVQDPRVRNCWSATARSPRHASGSAAYFIVDCADLDDALRLGALCPVVATGAIEVRPIAGESLRGLRLR